MTAAQIEATVRELADKEAIRDLARRYAHHVWHKDVAAIVDLFVADGVMDTSLEAPIRGRASLLEAFERLVAGDDKDFQPFVHNHVVDLDGDTASGTAYVDLRSIQDGRSMIGSGYYQDRYVREGERWKFQARGFVLRFLVPLLDGWAESAAAES